MNDFGEVTLSDLANPYLWPHLLCAHGSFSFLDYNEIENPIMSTDVDGILVVSRPYDLGFIDILGRFSIEKRLC